MRIHVSVFYYIVLVITHIRAMELHATYIIHDYVKKILDKVLHVKEIHSLLYSVCTTQCCICTPEIIKSRFV